MPDRSLLVELPYSYSEPLCYNQLIWNYRLSKISRCRMKRWLVLPLLLLIGLAAYQNDPVVVSSTTKPTETIAAATIAPTYTPTDVTPTALPMATLGPTPVATL